MPTATCSTRSTAPPAAQVKSDRKISMGSREPLSTVGTTKSRACAVGKPSVKKGTRAIGFNWRKAKEYPKSNDLDLLHWRWEFLRRNQEYQQDWFRLSSQEAIDIRTWKKSVLHRARASPSPPPSAPNFCHSSCRSRAATTSRSSARSSSSPTATRKPTRAATSNSAPACSGSRST